MHPIRSEIIQQNNKFTGSFDSLSQVQSVPKNVLALTSAFIDGEMTSSDQPSEEAQLYHRRVNHLNGLN